MSANDVVELRTSGTTGTPKLYHAPRTRLRESARRTCEALGLTPGGTALLCLPDRYVAGLMMRVRAEVWPLTLVEVEPSRHPLANVDQHIHFAAMTPMQVAATAEVPDEWQRLCHIDHLLVGGAPIDEHLERLLLPCTGNVWQTYAMTETLSNVALRRLSGPDASPWYHPLPGCTVTLDDDARLVVSALTVDECAGKVVTNDLGELNTRDHRLFRPLGRADDIINSGGVKINPLVVEARLAGRLTCPYMVLGVPDPLLGQAVALVLPPGHADEAWRAIEGIDDHLLRPRVVIERDRLPTTPTGKPLRRLD